MFIHIDILKSFDNLNKVFSNKVGNVHVQYTFIVHFMHLEINVHHWSIKGSAGTCRAWYRLVSTSLTLALDTLSRATGRQSCTSSDHSVRHPPSIWSLCPGQSCSHPQHRSYFRECICFYRRYLLSEKNSVLVSSILVSFSIIVNVYIKQ